MIQNFGKASGHRPLHCFSVPPLAHLLNGFGPFIKMGLVSFLGGLSDFRWGGIYFMWPSHFECTKELTGLGNSFRLFSFAS